MSSRNLTHEIVRDLGLAIVSGKYRTGESFPNEAQLSTSYGVSRTILREAVKMLTAKGMLGSRQRRGTWVEPDENWNLFDPDLLDWMLESRDPLNLLSEFTEIRLQIEPAAAAFAAQRASDEHLSDIADAIARMEAAERGQDDALLSDIAFHVAVLNASENRFFAQMSHLVATALKVSIRLTNQFKGVPLADVADHRKIADAIHNRDPQLALKESRAMIEEAMLLINQAKIETT